MLARGPARESGCIEPGDRIKCLNISFDDVTLQDACDLLNCGSPYKMRMLLEKRVLPPNLVRKLDQSNQAHRRPGATSGAGPPDGSLLAGPLNATRSYIRRLTSRLVGPPSQSAQDQFIWQPAADCQAGGQAAITADLAGGPLGSALARQQIQSRGFVVHDGDEGVYGHVNEAFGQDEHKHDDEHERVDGQSDSWRAGGRVPEQGAGPRRGSSARMRRHGSAAADHRCGGRQQLKSSSASELANALDATGASLSDIRDVEPARQQHAHHGLRGPPLLGERVIDLSQVDELDDRHDHHERNQASPMGSQQPARRQTVDATGGSSLLKSRNKFMAPDRHLEQSQSQPEIAASDNKSNERDLALHCDGAKSSGLVSHSIGNLAPSRVVVDFPGSPSDAKQPGSGRVRESKSDGRLDDDDS